MITEALVEFDMGGVWVNGSLPLAIPFAVECGRRLIAQYRRIGTSTAVRVVDAAGEVVAQWGKA